MAASPGGGGSHRSGFSGQGAGLLEQAVSEQQTFSAQLQGQLLVQGQLIMSLQRDVRCPLTHPHTHAHQSVNNLPPPHTHNIHTTLSPQRR